MPFMQAAVDKPFGFLPYDRVNSCRAYSKDSSAVAIYPGDAVILETDGGIGVAATGSTNIIGVAAMYSPASTAEPNFLVYDDPEQLFMVQDDNNTTQMAEAQVGNNVNIVTTTGDTSTLRSLQEIDSSTAATTAALAIKVLGLHPVEGRSFASAAGDTSQRKWIVKINTHLFSAYQQLGI